MTLSAPTFRVFLAGFVLSSLSALPSALSAQAAKPAASTAPNQAPASPFNGAVVEERVAQVNDQIISLSDYQRAEQQMDSDAQQQNWSPQELQEQKHDLLRDLIDKELLLSKAKELNITGETELVKRLDEIRKQNHLDSMEDLEKAAQEQGVSYEDFKQKIRNEIIIQEVTRQEVARHIQMTKAEVDNFYRAHQAEFAQPEAVHLDEILIPVAGEDNAALETAQQKAADVEAKLKAGTSFDELAKQDSAGPTASTGGDLGDFKRGALAKPIEDATFALKAGEVTQPIRTKQGLIILKVTQHTGGSSQDFSAIEPQVEEAAFMSRMQPELRKYLTTLRAQAYIDIRTGYEDAGKSQSSIKPIYSAYTPPGKKNTKAKVQRTRFRETGHSFRSKTTQQAAATTPAAPATTTAGVPATTAPATAATTAPATAKPTQVAANTTSSKPVKKQKVRYGQSPTGTLDSAPDSMNASAPAPAAGETQVASSVSSNITGPGIAATQGVEVKKTRFSDRVHEAKKVKPETQDQLENESQGAATPEEVATQKTQAAPVGLQGDTAAKKKQPKIKSDQKTRYADKPKAASDDQSNGATPEPASTTPAQQPADTTTPPAAAPATPQSPPQ
jgi:peptidyl-prolyl cis-trans isomerase SurA